jgi:hypothetical protein
MTHRNNVDCINNSDIFPTAHQPSEHHSLRPTKLERSIMVEKSRELFRTDELEQESDHFIDVAVQGDESDMDVGNNSSRYVYYTFPLFRCEKLTLRTITIAHVERLILELTSQLVGLGGVDSEAKIKDRDKIELALASRNDAKFTECVCFIIMKRSI